MPIFRQKSHWARKPYEWMDELEVGMVLLWGKNKTPRKIRAIGRNPWTDHLHDVKFAKLQKSQFQDPTTVYMRCDIRRMSTPILKKVSLCTTDVECRLQRCIDAQEEFLERYRAGIDRYCQDTRIDRCITQGETVGVVT